MLPPSWLRWAPYALLAIGCNGSPSGGRCATCGMKLDPTSAFGARAVGPQATRTFDSPKCALAGRKADEQLQVREYYTRNWVSADDAVRFVAGSDILGPMGHDLIPVARDRVETFRKDHGGRAPYVATEIPPEKAMDLAE